MLLRVATGLLAVEWVLLTITQPEVSLLFAAIWGVAALWRLTRERKEAPRPKARG